MKTIALAVSSSLSKFDPNWSFEGIFPDTETAKRILGEEYAHTRTVTWYKNDYVDYKREGFPHEANLTVGAFSNYAVDHNAGVYGVLVPKEEILGTIYIYINQYEIQEVARDFE